MATNLADLRHLVMMMDYGLTDDSAEEYEPCQPKPYVRDYDASGNPVTVVQLEEDEDC